MGCSIPYPWDIVSLPRPMRFLASISHFLERNVRFAGAMSPDRDRPTIASPSHTDNIRLVERSRHGDHGAFRQLFEAYSPLVYRIVYRMIGSPDDAADLTQDVFVRAYERLHTLKDGQAFHVWITKLSVNMVRDHLRRKRLDILSLNAAPPGCDEGTEWQIPDHAPDQDTRVITAEQTARIQQALLKLSPDHRMVVILHHLEGMPVEDISTTLQIPTGTVKSRLARARAELRRQLDAYLTANAY